MALILCIETATRICSISLSLNGHNIQHLETNLKNSHAEQVTKYIKIILNECKTDIEQLDAVAISSGPGSYTGLRIGMASSKGICFALDIPLIKVNTLASLAVPVIEKYKDIPDHPLFVPMLDARRQEVFTAVYDGKLKQLEKPKPLVFDLEKIPFEEYAGNRLYYFGNGAEKARQFMKGQNASYVENIEPSATNMAKIAFEHYNEKRFENLGNTQADYFKAFYTTSKSIKL